MIGLPGDKIQMIKGRLYINGVVVPREPAPAYQMDDGFSKPTEVHAYCETLPDSQGHPGGVRHEIIQLAGDEGAVVQHRRVHGAARPFFHDGRQPRQFRGFALSRPGPVGYVPAENLVGRAEIIFFSVGEGAAAWEFWRWPWTIRWTPPADAGSLTRAMTARQAGARANSKRGSATPSPTLRSPSAR